MKLIKSINTSILKKNIAVVEWKLLFR